MHPRSQLHKLAPELVAYTGLTRTDKRTYMSTLSAVDSSWLVEMCPAVCTLSAPARDATPMYDSARDSVIAWSHATYGAFNWPLPLHAGTPDVLQIFLSVMLVLTCHVQVLVAGNTSIRPGLLLAEALCCEKAFVLAVGHPDEEERSACFAAALLSGKVVPSLGMLRPLYNCSPEQVASKAGRVLARVATLLSVLQQKRVCSKQALKAQWRQDGTC
jgi:hypothetical protein